MILIEVSRLEKCDEIYNYKQGVFNFEIFQKKLKELEKFLDKGIFFLLLKMLEFDEKKRISTN